MPLPLGAVDNGTVCLSRFRRSRFLPTEGEPVSFIAPNMGEIRCHTAGSHLEPGGEIQNRVLSGGETGSVPFPGLRSFEKMLRGAVDLKEDERSCCRKKPKRHPS